MSGLALGIDIGGTFTDIVIYDRDTGRHVIRKALTRHDDRACVRAAASRRVFVRRDQVEEFKRLAGSGAPVLRVEVLEDYLFPRLYLGSAEALTLREGRGGQARRFKLSQLLVFSP